MRSVALSTEQPCGIVGRLNPTRARRFAPFLDMTLRIESEPLLLVGLPSSIQASALAVRVCWEPQSTVELWIVQLYVADWELLAASVARTSNVWGLTARPEYDFGESQAASAAPSRRHSVVTAPPQLSLVVKANCAVVSAVVAAGFSVMEVLGADVERVRAEAEAGVVDRRVAQAERRTVERALERRGLAGREREARAGRVDRALRAAVDRDDRGREVGDLPL